MDLVDIPFSTRFWCLLSPLFRSTHNLSMRTCAARGDRKVVWGSRSSLVDDRRLLLKRKVEREALLGVISEIAFVSSSKRRLCSLNYTVKTIL